MLKTFLRLLSGSRQNPVPIDPSTPDSVVLFAYLKDPNRPQNPNANPSAPAVARTKNHREWLLSMQLQHSKLCSQRRCEELRAFGIETTGDLIAANLESLANRFDSPQKAIRTLKRYRHAVNFAATVPEMMPREALLLLRIHRRSVRSLAMESPMLLYRDMQRFAESSPGRRMLRGRRLPSVKKIRRWIQACEARLMTTRSSDPQSEIRRDVCADAA